MRPCIPCSMMTCVRLAQFAQLQQANHTSYSSVTMCRRFWQTKSEAKGENPAKDPLAIIGTP